MDADNNLIKMVDDDQGEGVKDFLPDEETQKLQMEAQLTEMEKELKVKSDAEEMLDNLKEEEDPIPWLPETGTKFILKFDKGEREYKVTYINQGKFRFSSEPTDKSYLK